jgi:hypothetical protein
LEEVAWSRDRSLDRDYRDIFEAPLRGSSLTDISKITPAPRQRRGGETDATDRATRGRRRTRLDAFYTEHRQCGDVDAGVDGLVVWFDCECGARTARRADEGDALDVTG